MQNLPEHGGTTRQRFAIKDFPFPLPPRPPHFLCHAPPALFASRSLAGAVHCHEIGSSAYCNEIRGSLCRARHENWSRIRLPSLPPSPLALSLPRSSFSVIGDGSAELRKNNEAALILR
jgi:hypothetical protein